METQVIAIDPAALFKTTGKNKQANTEADQAFAAIFAQIAQGMENKSSVAALKSTPLQSNQTYAVSSSRSGETTLSSPAGTPIARLEQALRQSGAPLKRFEVSAAHRGQLEEVLVKSGYSREKAQELIDRASKEDGKINLGALFNLMPEYLPTQGPQLLLNIEDRPLLIQVLKDLGVSEKEIQEYVQSLPQRGNQLVVSGLPKLLAEVSAKLKNGEKEGAKVDQGVLKDLLTRLGLNEKEVDILIANSLDQKGNTDPKAVLALLEAAAERQNETMGQALKDMAAKLMIASSTEEAPSDLERLRSQVIKILQQLETGDKNQGQDLKAALKAVLASGEDEGGESGLPFGEKNQGQGSFKDSGRQAQDGAAREAVNLVKNSQDAGQTRLDKAPQEQNAQKAQTTEDQSTAAKAVLKTGQPASQANAAGGPAQATARLAQAAQQRPSLPAYVVRQVSTQMVQMVRRQLPNLRLTLNPPELGQLNIELSVKDGVVRVTILAETAAAKSALDSGLEQLRHVLAQQGLKTERLEVLVNPDAQQRQAQSENGNKNNSRRDGQESVRQVQGASPADAEEEAALQATRTAAGVNSVNLFA